MTTSAPQWPGQEGMSERPEAEQPRTARLESGAGRGGGSAAVVDLSERRRRQAAAAGGGAAQPVRGCTGRGRAGSVGGASAGQGRPAVSGGVTRDIALALLEVEAGCRSAAQLERVFSPQLWEALEHRIGRRGGPLPSGRRSSRCDVRRDRPGLADTVAVVRRGALVRPVALRLGHLWRPVDRDRAALVA